MKRWVLTLAVCVAVVIGTFAVVVRSTYASTAAATGTVRGAIVLLNDSRSVNSGGHGIPGVVRFRRMGSGWYLPQVLVQTDGAGNFDASLAPGRWMMWGFRTEGPNRLRGCVAQMVTVRASESSGANLLCGYSRRR